MAVEIMNVHCVSFVGDNLELCATACDDTVKSIGESIDEL